MRPQDIRNMRTGDIDMSGDVWIYRAWTHKNDIMDRIARLPLAQRLRRSYDRF